MEADLTLEELQDTMKSKGMKDTAPGPDGIPYSVYGNLTVVFCGQKSQKASKLFGFMGIFPLVIYLLPIV